MHVKVAETFPDANEPGMAPERSCPVRFPSGFKKGLADGMT